MLLGQQMSLRRWKVSRAQTILAVVLAVGGFLAVTQVHNELLIRRELRMPSQQLEELGYRLRDQERSRAAVEREILQLRDRLRTYEQGAAQGRAKLEELTHQLEDRRLLAGLTTVGGSGVEVEVNDSPLPLRPGDDPNTVILHYTDLQGVLNELWASGAEAVALNGERMVATTGLTCVGTTILANTKRVAPPYRVVAIGDAEAMYAYLQRPGGVLDSLRAFGFPVRVSAAAQVTVPAYRGGFQFTYAQPVATPP